MKSKCCKSPIVGVIDLKTPEEQLGIEKLRYCKNCKIILEGKRAGYFYKNQKICYQPILPRKK